MRIKKMIPKKHYIFTLLYTFYYYNTLLIYRSIFLPQYSHYSCMLLAYHCSVCLIDILYVKNLTHHEMQ